MIAQILGSQELTIYQEKYLCKFLRQTQRKIQEISDKLNIFNQAEHQRKDFLHKDTPQEEILMALGLIMEKCLLLLLFVISITTTTPIISKYQYLQRLKQILLGQYK